MNKTGRTLNNFCLLLLTGIGLLYAANDAQAASPWKKNPRESRSDSAKLAITPSVCVIKQKGDSCQQRLTLLYRSKQRHNICIYHSFSNEPIWCDNQVKQADLEVTITASKNIKLTAKNNDNNDTLATATFALSVFQPVKKRKRRHYGIGIL
ncbi:DUF3019 domain-containing protein [Kangiella sp. TOML190]|uniref:DUF3019 domain-containing protein n=1 Tax=Kangiella sp. TOML190 TaxID=2931351 RepID=UPI00203A3B7B|nr:DUF3019 domain-containing protein [Kangiella sp. TOML190]